jgi:hypothetical protein
VLVEEVAVVLLRLEVLQVREVLDKFLELELGS